MPEVLPRSYRRGGSLKHRRAAAMVVSILATATGSCDSVSDWTLIDVQVEPQTLTAGSDEEWHIRVEVDLGTVDLEPSVISMSVEPRNVEGSAWFLLDDSGTWGDAVRGDGIFERRGLHPFTRATPPGKYTLRIAIPRWGAGGSMANE